MIITEKNMNMVAGRLRKFFNSDRYFREWHNFRGGLKPRIKHNYFEGERIENYYYNVSTRMNRYGSAFIVDLNSDEADVFTVGDTVLFKGNRVIHKSVMPMKDTRYCYTCYQIIAKSDPDYDEVANYAESSKHCADMYAESSKYYADMYYEDYAEYCDRFDDEPADIDPEDDDGPEMGYDLDPARDFQCFDLPPEAHYDPTP